MPEPYHPPETSEKPLENQDQKPLEKPNINPIEKPTSSTKTPEIYDYKTCVKLDFNKVTDNKGGLFDSLKHLWEEKNGKIHVKRTKKGFLAADPSRESANHAHKIAVKQARLEQEEKEKVAAAEEVVTKKLEEQQEKEAAIIGASEGAVAIVEGFFSVGSFLFGDEFEKATPGEVKRLQRASESFLKHNPDFKMSPGWTMIGAFGMYGMRHAKNPDPDSFMGRRKAKKIEAQQEEQEENETT